tara:strand:+ start:1195 stop:1425 length:231 start_codon:yes stop_codon:yes gene_type:complete
MAKLMSRRSRVSSVLLIIFFKFKRCGDDLTVLLNLVNFIIKYPNFSREESQILYQAIMNADIQISADASQSIKDNK